jgi:hypothetical protein
VAVAFHCTSKESGHPKESATPFMAEGITQRTSCKAVTQRESVEKSNKDTIHTQWPFLPGCTGLLKLGLYRRLLKLRLHLRMRLLANAHLL